MKPLQCHTETGPTPPPRWAGQGAVHFSCCVDPPRRRRTQRKHSAFGGCARRCRGRGRGRASPLSSAHSQGSDLLPLAYKLKAFGSCHWHSAYRLRLPSSMLPSSPLSAFLPFRPARHQFLDWEASVLHTFSRGRRRESTALAMLLSAEVTGSFRCRGLH